MSDDFNRANGGLGANWTSQVNTALAISSNHVIAGSSGENEASYYNGAWSNDQESSAVFTWGGTAYLGVTVRASGTGGSFTCYYFLTDGSSYSELGKYVSGAQTILSTSFAHPASGSVVKIRAVGTAINIYDDGVAIGGSPFTDASIASGNPGIYDYDGGAFTAHIDDWNGADVGGGGGGSAIPRIVSQFRKRRAA